jgi:undecaprenyl-diphosphatase
VLWAAGTALLLAGTLFFFIASGLVDGVASDRLVQTDLWLMRSLQAHASPVLTQCMLAITYLHALPMILVYSAVLAAWLAHRREFGWLLALALAVPPGMLLNALLKLMYERARPALDEPLLVLDTYSFPSGHASAAVLFYGFVAACFVPRLSGWGARTACIAAALLMPVLVGLSRIYLGVHFPSDVLAAMSVALAWLALSLASVHALRQRRRPRT